MTGRLKAIAILTMGLLVLPAAVNAAAPAAQPPAAEQRSDDAVRDVPTPASHQDPAPALAQTVAKAGTEAYAQREAAAKGLETFEGGGAGIYIGGSTAGILLLVVLLIVLL